jgi:hypothetical protein
MTKTVYVKAANKKTYNKGANDERTALMAKLRRDRASTTDIWVMAYLDTLMDWLMGRATRAGQAPGGIGRKLLKPTTKTRPAVKAQKLVNTKRKVA